MVVLHAVPSFCEEANKEEGWGEEDYNQPGEGNSDRDGESSFATAECSEKQSA